MHTNSTPVATQLGTIRGNGGGHDHEMERKGSRSHSLDDAFPTLANLQAQQERGGKISSAVVLNLPPTPTLMYTSASSGDRPVAGLPKQGYRGRSRTNNASSGSVSSSASGGNGYQQHLSSSSPEFANALPLPPPVGSHPQPPAGGLQLPPDSFMDFSQLIAGGHQPPLSSSSIFSEESAQAFFDLPHTLSSSLPFSSLPSSSLPSSSQQEDTSNTLTPTLGGPSSTQLQADESLRMSGGVGRSRFNVPLGDQEFQF
jgi:hypothetical protein